MSASRQTGVTAQQMRDAPRDSVYIWVNQHLSYPLRLAAILGRDDLKVVSPGWLRPSNVYGQRREVVVDHACWLSFEQQQCLREMQRRAVAP